MIGLGVKVQSLGIFSEVGEWFTSLTLQSSMDEGWLWSDGGTVEDDTGDTIGDANDDDDTIGRAATLWRPGGEGTMAMLKEIK